MTTPSQSDPSSNHVSPPLRKGPSRGEGERLPPHHARLRLVPHGEVHLIASPACWRGREDAPASERVRVKPTAWRHPQPARLRSPPSPVPGEGLPSSPPRAARGSSL